MHTDRLAHTGRGLHRIVEPGEITVMLGSSGTHIRLTGILHLTGPVRRVGHGRVLRTPARIG